MSLSAEAPWLRFYGDMPEHIDYPRKTLFQCVAQTAQAHPDAVAYEFEGGYVTYAGFLRRVERAAAAFVSLGIARGDRVTLCLPNLPQAVDCFYALSRIGAVANMIHPLSSADEITFYLNCSQSKAIIALDGFCDRVMPACRAAKSPPELLLVRISDALPFPKAFAYRLAKRSKLPQGYPYCLWSGLLRKASASLPPDDGASDTCAVILYSGGTTGKTKGICLSSDNFNALAYQTIAASGCQTLLGCSMLSVMPMFHGFGLGIGIHTALVGGARCILVPRFSVRLYADLLRKKRPSFIPGVPTLFEALLCAPGLENVGLSFLKGVFCGGDSLSVELKRRVDRFLSEHGACVQIREGYGTTECVTASCLTPLRGARDGSIGIPFPDTYYKIVRVGTTEEVAAGQNGEICLSGPSVMLGYLDEPEETAHALRRHADGRVWLHTGDLGCMDADGFLYFRQRLKRIIVTSGYNVYPSQVENVLDGHEAVQLSCVIGVRDAYKMQRVRAYVVLKPGVVASEALRRELLDFCRAHIVRYAAPTELLFRDELPKTAVGKVAYRALEEEAAQEEST